MRHIGDAVIYRPRPGAVGRPGVIERVTQLVSVKFSDYDGGTLQCNPHCLELADEPTLFGSVHDGSV